MMKYWNSKSLPSCENFLEYVRNEISICEEEKGIKFFMDLENLPKPNEVPHATSLQQWKFVKMRAS